MRVPYSIDFYRTAGHYLARFECHGIEYEMIITDQALVESKLPLDNVVQRYADERVGTRPMPAYNYFKAEMKKRIAKAEPQDDLRKEPIRKIDLE